MEDKSKDVARHKGLGMTQQQDIQLKMTEWKYNAPEKHSKIYDEFIWIHKHSCDAHVLAFFQTEITMKQGSVEIQDSQG